ncbi:MAG TPA: hypothetical protein VK659_05115 [Asanoa sp.]|nr:hypothetical protein [Asanoa sp.]
MRWWVRARRAHAVLPAALLLFTVLLVVVQNGTAALPSAFTGTQQVALLMFVPVPVLSALMLCLESRLAAQEATGIRPVRSLDAALAVATVAACAALALAVGALIGSIGLTGAGAVARNTAFLTGLMLAVRAVAGQTAIMAPVGWLLAVMFVGFRAGNDPYPWTVLPEPTSAPHAALGAALMLAAGLAALLLTPPNPRTAEAR